MELEELVWKRREVQPWSRQRPQWWPPQHSLLLLSGTPSCQRADLTYTYLCTSPMTSTVRQRECLKSCQHPVPGQTQRPEASARPWSQQGDRRCCGAPGSGTRGDAGVLTFHYNAPVPEDGSHRTATVQEDKTRLPVPRKTGCTCLSFTLEVILKSCSPTARWLRDWT